MSLAIFILDLKGKSIMSRSYRWGVHQKRIVKTFVKRVVNEEDSAPVFNVDGITYCFIKHNNLYFLLTTKSNPNVSMLMSFLYEIVEVFKKYFQNVEEESVKDNFVIVYELLDEMVDFGYPQTSDFQVLQEFIKKKDAFTLGDFSLEGLNINGIKSLVDSNLKSLTKNFKSESENTSQKLSIPKRLTGIGSRKTGIVYEKNEVFLDVIEGVNMVVSKQGNVINSVLEGMLKMKCYLSGLPMVKLGLNDKVLFENLGRDISRRKTVDLDDIQFHKCVRLNKFEKDRTILFRPPDGEFILMKYRLNSRIKPLFMVNVKSKIFSNSRVEFTVLLKTNFTARCVATIVDVFIPVPQDTEKVNFDTSSGRVDYLPESECVRWQILSVRGKSQLTMKGEVTLPSIQKEDEEKRKLFQKKPIKVNFKIPYYSVSKLQVRYLKVIEKSGYTVLPLCRYMTVNGDYQIRQY